MKDICEKVSDMIIKRHKGFVSEIGKPGLIDFIDYFIQEHNIDKKKCSCDALYKIINDQYWFSVDYRNNIQIIIADKKSFVQTFIIDLSQPERQLAMPFLC